MTRKELVQKVFNAGSELTMSNPLYKDSVLKYLEVDGDDVTTAALIDENQNTTAKIMKKSPGIFCGIEEILYFFPKARVTDNGIEIHGNARDILAMERGLLNFLMRMSGIATYTQKMVKIAGPEVLLVPTRKTLWGLLDKRAATAGGAGTHRLDLGDAVLIKDNHLDLLDRDIEKALNLAFENAKNPRFIEIEVDTAKEAMTAKAAFSKIDSDIPKVIMLDNMSPADISEVIDDSDILFEASGGITEENLKDYAKTGVDIISMGALTIHGHSLDFSMEAS
jgi:nicotinate-nucleotide pyrophosphorylase (carboxylating)